MPRKKVSVEEQVSPTPSANETSETNETIVPMAVSPVQPLLAVSTVLAHHHELNLITRLVRQGSYAQSPTSLNRSFNHSYYLQPVKRAYDTGDTHMFWNALSDYLYQLALQVAAAGKVDDVPQLVEQVQVLVEELDQRGERGLELVARRILSTAGAPL